MGNYSKQWSTATPGYLIFLVDQSSSMAKIWKDDKSFAELTAEVINQTINELIATNAAGETVKNRVFVSLIGYGGDNAVEDIRSDYLAKYADSPLRVETSIEIVSDGQNGEIEMQDELPIFLEPKCEGVTPMSGAFALAKRLIEKWIDVKNDNPVPVIINVSDGHPEDGDKENPNEETIKTIKIANEIMKLSTFDGNPLIFNVHISDTGKEIEFPQFKFELDNDDMAELLFQISSEVPAVYRKAAKDLNLQKLKDNSKGFISNASPDTLIKFINFGSSGGIDRTSINN